MVYVVMGVSGSGKTTIVSLLGAALGLPHYDADNYHPPSNIEKMELDKQSDQALSKREGQRMMIFADKQGAAGGMDRLRASIT